MSHPVLRYAVPLALLTGVAAAGCFLPRSFRPLGRAAQLAAATLAALPLLASGVMHLARPQAFVPLLPPWVPERPLVIILTGLPELAGAIGLFHPRFRQAAGRWLIVMMIAIFPANVYVAGTTVHGLPMPGVPARTAMQAGYIVLLLVASHGLPRLRAAPGRVSAMR